MKNKIVLILIAIVTTANLYSQDYFLYVSTKDERLKPSAKSAEFSVPTNETLTQIFKEFEVISYYQSFPGAMTPELQHFYEIHFKGDVDKFEKVLKDMKIFDEVYRCDYYKPAICSSPVVINDPFPTPTTKAGLDLLEAECAWTITKGSSNIVVAVVDTEFDTTHKDMVNTFVGTVGTRTDPRNHGTEVSSCVATGVNNGIGIAGIGYNTKVKGYYVNGYTVWNGIWAAYQDGIKIINVSWSGIGSYPNLLAVKEMTNNGVVLVLATGNIIPDDSLCHKDYANIPGVINVSGVDWNNNHENTKQVHNAWVDVCAMSALIAVCYPENNSYFFAWGTSFAAPQVAGVVALMRSINNSLTPAEIENMIKATTDPIADAAKYPGELGTGRVNAYKAVLAATNTCNITGIQPPHPQTHKSVTCKEINTDATVPTSTKLELNTLNGGSVTLNPNFTVETGAELEINILQ